ncbi:putative lipopolysaccharide heptosyltransferase III [Yersinia ruckeri]|uniref:putative lipopolysaccharide heptosyltransferase III n=1 Tax=Yersinia ruckeri TaxID=29486 RepID=UPI000670949B|nr:putative lipopolysaccharide heptosyltransferase III [Yersinia ruckeri]EKN4197320.1 putative lipopolysaccharide heptosyltransferase III [Yersinia ruckeri]EKN4204493.1 putative lipopolysaccharide heptosyltransferase III [Yersinia ruckeri]EKN4701770.1 putative lipopolysaccharide heptosyltransferase III [Yersinia ruckeri]
MMNTSNKTQPHNGQRLEPLSAAIIPEILRNKDNVQRILIIKLRHFGDVLLTTPVLNTLRANYPNALIDILLYSGTEAILAANDAINHVYTVDRQLKHAGLKAQFMGEKALFNTLKQQRYDVILNLSDQWRAGVYCRLLQPKLSIGLSYPKRQNRLWRYCHSLLVTIFQAEEQHTVLNNLAILEPLQLSEISVDVTMAYGEKDAQRTKEICQQHNIDSYVLIQPSARWKFKTWSSIYCSQLINYLTEKGESVIITGGKDRAELDYIAEILSQCSQPERIVNLAGTLNLTELAALIDQAKLFIGVDSVAMHMAAALQTPSVVLFGPSNLKQWHPWKSPHSLLWAGSYAQIPEPRQIDTNTSERYLDSIPVIEVQRSVDFWLSGEGIKDWEIRSPFNYHN